MCTSRLFNRMKGALFSIIFSYSGLPRVWSLGVPSTTRRPGSAKYSWRARVPQGCGRISKLDECSRTSDGAQAALGDSCGYNGLQGHLRSQGPYQMLRELPHN